MHAHNHSLSSAINTQRHSLTQTTVVKHEVVMPSNHFLLIICYQLNVYGARYATGHNHY